MPDTFAETLRRMHHRDGVDTLPEHLAAAHGIDVATITQLDVGVFRIDRADRDSPVVARLFSAARAYEQTECDLGVLRHLADIDFPAERPVGDVSTHQGQAVLVTEFVRAAPKAKQPTYPVVRLGARVGTLHTLDVPPAVDRPAGALHHFAEGTMRDELQAAAGWLDAVPSAATDDLRAALESADGGDGLPEAFVHPDPVPKNAIFTADGPVLVDWAGAGRGPRLASLTPVLRSGWAAAPFLDGYTRRVTLTAEERERLPALLVARRLVDLVFRACRDPQTAATAVQRLPRVTRAVEAKARALLAAVRAQA